MYTPKLFSDNLYKLWNNENATRQNAISKPSLNQADDQYNSQINGANVENNEDDEQREDQNINSRNLFAPPLSAFSAEYAGASSAQLEYTINQNRLRTGNQLVTPLTQKKIEELQRIRNVGYRRFAPLGINRTMEQLELEGSSLNISAMDYSRGAVENTSQVIENPSRNNVSNSMIDQDEQNLEAVDIDLDAEIPNADESSEIDDSFGEVNVDSNFRSVDTDDDIFDEDQGFMAEDVEYQDDHNVAASSLSAENAILHSGPLILPNTDSIRSHGSNSGRIQSDRAPIFNTRISSGATDIRNDTGNERSEFDMVLDHNN